MNNLSIFLSCLVLVGGGILILIQLRSKRLSWVGLPFLLLTVSAMRDIGTTPLAMYFLNLNHQNASALAVPLTPQNILPGMGLTFWGYIAVSAGMVLAIPLVRKKAEVPLSSKGEKLYDKNLTARAWQSSLLIFIVGVVCNIYMIVSLLKNSPFFDLAASRAFITDETLVFERFYLWARMFSSLMGLGAMSLLLFANKRIGRLWFALIANMIYIAILSILGSRLSAISHFIAMGMVFHYGVKKLRFEQIAVLAALTTIGLYFITMIRFNGGASSKYVFDSVIGQIFVSPALECAVFALQTFPSRIPYFGMWTSLGGLLYLFPTFNTVRTPNIWLLLVDIFYGGVNPTGGIGGEHYAFASEHFMVAGYFGVIILGLIYGLIFGCIFTWQRRYPRNPFLLLLAVNFSIVLFRSYNGKMAANIGGTGFGVLLPIGLMVALTFWSNRRIKYLALSLYLFIMFLFFRYWTGSDLFDYGSMFVTVAGYLASLQLIGVAGKLPFRSAALSAHDGKEQLSGQKKD